MMTTTPQPVALAACAVTATLVLMLARRRRRASVPTSPSRGIEHLEVRAVVVTAFTENYAFGHLTAPVNRAYAVRHGYEFVCRVTPQYDWTLPGTRHPTWDKVALILEQLHRALHGGPEAACTHILWVDADAVILGQHLSVRDLWRCLPPSVDLIIGEDVTPTCLVNAGVLCIRVSEWSLKLWSDVWQSEASERFHRRSYHEQSALLEQLRRRAEGLDAVTPFHSYRGGPIGCKLFEHVCVCPRHALNTNHGDLREPWRSDGVATKAAMGIAADAAESSLEWRCDFVFHAAGKPTLARCGPGGVLTHWRPSKMAALEAMVAHAGLAAHTIGSDEACSLPLAQEPNVNHTSTTK